MPRPRRVYIPGLSVHAFQRGLNRRTVVHDESDYAYLLAQIAEAAIDGGIDVHGFSLMTTHFHVVVTPKHPRGLPDAMHDIDGQYSRYYNRKYNRIGHLWNGPYGATIIEDERQWLTCLRYVDLNAVHAQVVKNPAADPWSSYRVHALGEPCEWLVEHPVYTGLGPTPGERQAAYRAICSET